MSFYCINNYIQYTHKIIKRNLKQAQFAGKEEINKCLSFLYNDISNKLLPRSICHLLQKLIQMFKIFEVQCIIDQTVINYEPHFLIKWKNLGHQHDTWQPISSLNNIREYLQYWINQRRQLRNKSKDKAKNKNYSKIKPYLYGGQFLSKNKREKYSNDILNRQKTWEKYIQKDNECIQIELDRKEGSNKHQMDEKINNKRTQRATKRYQKRQDNLKTVEMEQQKQAYSHFNAIGEIDIKQINQIIRAFYSNKIRCLEIELLDGRRCNMIEAELSKHNPEIVLQFLEDQNIPF